MASDVWFKLVFYRIDNVPIMGTRIMLFLGVVVLSECMMASLAQPAAQPA